MKLGDAVSDEDSPGGPRYTISTPPTNSDGGQCQWAFAENGGHQYFIKEFLGPKFPRPGAPGSAASKAARLKECSEFADRHRDIMRRLQVSAPGGGNLVTALDFFRHGTMFYKVTHKVSVNSLESLAHLPVRERAVVLRTLANSLQILHRNGIVHGDLKPTNVLIQKKEGGFHVAKLIDFDDSYRAGSPPPPHQIVGDSVYGAPEWFSYTKEEPGADAKRLTTKTDMFSLGLLVHQYLTGALPGHRDFAAPALMVAAGKHLEFDQRLGPRITAVLKRMTAAEPRMRPTAKEFFGEINDENVLAHTEPGRATPAAGGRLKLNFGATPDATPDAAPGATPGAPVRTPEPKPAPHRSRLRINDLNTD